MQIYARVHEGLVMEVLAPNQSIKNLFHPDIVWVMVPEGASVVPGMRYDGKEFSSFEERQHDSAPSLHAIMQALLNVQEQLGALKGQT